MRLPPENLLMPLQQPRPPHEVQDGWFDLEDWIGSDRPSSRADVAKVEAILAEAGDLSLERTQGPTGYWGLSQDRALRAYQKRHGLAVDGTLRPGGPTIADMAERYGDIFAGRLVPTPDDIDAHHDVLAKDGEPLIAWERGPDTDQPLGSLIALRRDDPMKQFGWEVILPGSGGRFGGAAGAGRRTPNLLMPPRTQLEHGDPPERLIPPEIPDPNDTGGFRPAPPAPTQTGGPAPVPLQTEPLVNEILGEVFPSVFEARKVPDNRGLPATVSGNDDIARHVLKCFKEAGLEDVTKQIGGATKGGDEETYLKEKIVKAINERLRRPDLSFEGNVDGVRKTMHVNTVTTDSKGDPIPRESSAGADIGTAEGVDVFAMSPKRAAGETTEQYLARITPELDSMVDRFVELCRSLKPSKASDE